MDKKWYDRLKQQFGDAVNFDKPDEGQDIRWVGADFESRQYCKNPAELMRRLGAVGLVQGLSGEGPKFALVGQSSTYTGPQGLRFSVTLEDLSAPLDSEE